MSAEERTLLLRMATTEGMTEVAASGLSPDFFEEPFCGNVFRWMVNDY